MQKQKGFTFWSLTMTVGVIVVVALVTIKLFPAYTEFLIIKKALVRIGNDTSLTSKTDIQKSFDKTAAVEDIKSIKAVDLEITADESGNKVVSVEYQVIVPMVANVSALLDFYASSNPEAEAAE